MKPRFPHPLIAVIPVILLVIMITVSVGFFGANAMNGANQISMLLSAAVCVTLSMTIYRTPWATVENGIRKTIGDTIVPILILLLIGMISGTWMISGVVPTLIYYGIQIISPQFYLVCSCLICAVISVMTGSSWTTIATIGIALLGIGNALGIPDTWSAGAIISGAYFGDKVSPLSDTTVLASSSSDVNLFDHIRYMFLTTIPSMTVALIVFLVAGISMCKGNEIHIDEYIVSLDHTFTITPWTLLVPVITGVLIARRTPVLITLFIASLAACVCALVFQSQVLSAIDDNGNMFRGLMTTCFGSTALDSGNLALNDLISTSGMAGMLNTVWLILCALTFGGVMMATNMIQSITSSLIKYIKGRVSLVFSTVITGIFSNLATSDQYMSIILTSSMFKGAYHRLGYENRLLSRSAEDSATVTSVLIPWNTCGLTQATVLGVSTLAYLPYCIFNLVSPLMSIIVAAIGWRIKRVEVNQDIEP